MVAASVAKRTSDTADIRFSALSVNISLASWSAAGSKRERKREREIIFLIVEHYVTMMFT